MDKFALTLSPSAIRDLDRLDIKIASNVLDRAAILEENPFPKGKLKKKIKGKRSTFYRLRVGKYRVFYCIGNKEVVVLKIIDKKDAEKFIKSL